MYPQGELKVLAWRKARLRRKIAVQRDDCAEAASRVAEPLAWIDRALAQWRRLSPFLKFAALPLGFVLKRSLLPRTHLLGTLLRWAPAAFGLFRSFKGAGR